MVVSVFALIPRDIRTLRAEHLHGSSAEEVADAPILSGGLPVLPEDVPDDLPDDLPDEPAMAGSGTTQSPALARPRSRAGRQRSGRAGWRGWPAVWLG